MLRDDQCHKTNQYVQFDGLFLEMEYGSCLQIAFRHPKTLLYSIKLVITLYDCFIIYCLFFQIGVITFNTKQLFCFFDKVFVKFYLLFIVFGKLRRLF